MLKIIRRVLRLSGNLSKRIWGSFFCGFLEDVYKRPEESFSPRSGTLILLQP